MMRPWVTLVLGFTTGVALVTSGVMGGWPLDRVHAFLVLAGTITTVLSIPIVRHALAARLSVSLDYSDEVQRRIESQPWRLTIYAAWFVCVVGLVEIGYYSYQKLISQTARLSYAYMWRVPIGYAVVYGLVLTGAVLVGWLRPSRRVFAGFAGVCAFILAAAWIPLFVHDLYYWSVLLVALGVGVQAGRMIPRHAYVFDRTCRFSLPVLLTLQVGLATTFPVLFVRQERAAITRLTPVAERRPNVLLVVCDTLRAESLGIYGYSRGTSPNLDRFASQGVIFDRAIASAPWTLPSHASMFTGRDPSELVRGFGSPMSSRFPTLAEVMQQYGYLTAGFVANRLYLSTGYGLDRGFQHYKAERTSLTTSLMRTSLGDNFLDATKIQAWGSNSAFGRKNAASVNAELLEWLSSRDPGRPFFAFLNYFDTHAPFLPPRDFALKFSNVIPVSRFSVRPFDAWKPQEIRELNDAYDGAIAYLDHHLGQLMAALNSRGILNNTLVIITSDHGEQFGEHGLLEHAASLYSTLLHVPLVMVYPPAIPAGKRVTSTVSLRSLPATILDLAALPNTFRFPSTLGDKIRSREVEAQSAPVFSEVDRVTAAYPDHYPARQGPMKSLVFGGVHYIYNEGTRREELYSLVDDPGELHDLAKTRIDLLEEGRKRLAAWLKQRAEPAVAQKLVKSRR